MSTRKRNRNGEIIEESAHHAVSNSYISYLEKNDVYLISFVTHKLHLYIYILFSPACVFVFISILRKSNSVDLRMHVCTCIFISSSCKKQYVHVFHLFFLTYLSSSLQVEHKVLTYLLRSRWSIRSTQKLRSLHSALFFALFSASPHVILRSFSSPSTVRHQVVSGLPIGCFPCGVHLRTVFVILEPSILKT